MVLGMGGVLEIHALIFEQKREIRYQQRLGKHVFTKLNCKICTSHADNPPVS